MVKTAGDNMLNDNFRKIIEIAVRTRIFNYTVEELYANAPGEASGSADTILKIQNDIAKELKSVVNTTPVVSSLMDPPSIPHRAPARGHPGLTSEC